VVRHFVLPGHSSKTLPDRNTRSNTHRPRPPTAQPPLLSRNCRRSPAQFAAVPSSAVSPAQNTAVTPPLPSQSLAAVPERSPAPRHTYRGCAPLVPPATGLSVSDTRALFGVRCFSPTAVGAWLLFLWSQCCADCQLMNKIPKILTAKHPSIESPLERVKDAQSAPGV